MRILRALEYMNRSIRNICMAGIPVFFVVFYSLNCTATGITGINEVTSTYDKALYEILSLNTVTARKILDNEYKRYPEVNMYLEYLENWNNVLETVLCEDPEKYEKYLESLEARLKLIDSKADKESPSYRILLAEIYAQAGMTNIFYRDYLAGFIKIMKANNYARENLEKYPDYWLNNKLCGVLNVSLDQLSPFLKKMAGLVNLKGNPETGFRQLSRYLKDVEGYPGLKAEALLYNGFALKMAKNDNKAYSVFKENITADHAPVLTLYLYSNIMYLTGRNEQARSILSKLAGTRFEVRFPFSDYLYGKSKLCRLDKDADIYLRRFMTNSKSKNYKKEIYCRLSDYYLIYSDPEQFAYCKKMIGVCSKATTDRDREADVESKRNYTPHPQILKARYLIHGGYYAEAYEILQATDPGELTLKAYRNEYFLLMARIKFNTNQPDEALIFCENTIANGRECSEHYAAEAALLAGDIHTKKGSREKAENYYKLASEIKGSNDVYIENIQKAANNRLKNI